MKSRRAAIFEVAAAELCAVRKFLRKSGPTPKERLEAHAATMRVNRLMQGCTGWRLPKCLEEKISIAQRGGEFNDLPQTAGNGENV